MMIGTYSSDFSIKKSHYEIDETCWRVSDSRHAQRGVFNLHRIKMGSFKLKIVSVRFFNFYSLCVRGPLGHSASFRRLVKRQLFVSPSLMYLMEIIRKRRQRSAEFHAAGFCGSNALCLALTVFPGEDGSFKSENSIQCIIKRYKAKYDLTEMGVHLYKFRHTFCTRLILAGQPLPVVQRLMGDNTPDIISKVYSHVTSVDATAAAQSFYEALNSKHQQPEV